MFIAFIVILLIIAYRQRELISHNKQIEEKSEALAVKNTDLINTQKN